MADTPAAAAAAPARPAPQWHVWRAHDGLEQSLLVRDPAPRARFGALVAEVQEVLAAWGFEHAGTPQLQSFLNGKGLLHEAEECVVGLHHVLGYLEAAAARGERPAVVDLCAGKGTFSVLLAALVARRPSLLGDDGQGAPIVLVEKRTAAQVNWNHVGALLGPGHAVQMWSGCNIHDAAFAARLRGLPGPLAIVAIHLCKNLSPCCAGLFNVLGRAKAPFLALAPCCVKLSGARVDVLTFEAPGARQARVASDAKRTAANQRAQCFYCGGQGHKAADCPTAAAAAAAGTALPPKPPTPCWRCGELGHRRSACTAEQPASRPAKVAAPATAIDLKAVSAAASPFDAWAAALLDVCETADGDSKRIDVVPLAGKARHVDPRNWNQGRKCTWVLAERVPLPAAAGGAAEAAAG